MLMNFNEITNPANAEMVLRNAGFVRIAFSKLNVTIKDMISVYASKLLDEHVLAGIYAASTDIGSIPNNSYFYIFTKRHYSMFLKLISRENAIKNNSITTTSESSVVFSTQQDCSYDGCPVFSLADSDAYNHIESTLYCKRFSRDSLHLCKLTTNRCVLGGKSVKLTEVCLYIPD